MNFKLKAGDTLPPLAKQLCDRDGPVNLNGFTVGLNMTSLTSGAAKIAAGACAVSTTTDLVSGAVLGNQAVYYWQPGDTAAADFYEAEFVATETATGNVWHFPDDGFFLVTITAHL
ncbi:MAG: hypothetical protein M3Y91_19015 [Actinomycetota bacterium]|nr:hypothetical protein [Actinomycetota bacterium]